MPISATHATCMPPKIITPVSMQHIISKVPVAALGLELPVGFRNRETKKRDSASGSQGYEKGKGVNHPSSPKSQSTCWPLIV